MGQRGWPAKTEGAGWCSGSLGGRAGGAGAPTPDPQPRREQAAPARTQVRPDNCGSAFPAPPERP